MKRSLAILLVILFAVGVFTGCGPDPEKVQEDFLAILDQSASEETIKEASDYLDKYLPKMDQAYANVMVHKLEHYILGFNQEGIIYTDWINKYKKYLDPVLLEFYQIMAREQESPMAVDAVLKLSWEELVQRTYELEQFIKTNKDYILIKDDFIWLYGKYINAMVMGTTGTPIFDYKTHAFSDGARDAYAAFINKYPDSTAAWALTEYFTYLNSIGYTMDYNDKISSKLFFDTCDWLVTESGKRVFQ
ncbi:MAG TPA: hypothetical protein VN381_05165 [Anaerovoracaceae bacterium]|nr:hypothetical protein [Anaerovoracaceae bacterium]